MTTNTFKPGDLALHKSGSLDARPVSRTEGATIWLQIGSVEAGPLPAANYRRIEQAERRGER